MFMHIIIIFFFIFMVLRHITNIGRSTLLGKFKYDIFFVKKHFIPKNFITSTKLCASDLPCWILYVLYVFYIKNSILGKRNLYIFEVSYRKAQIMFGDKIFYLIYSKCIQFWDAFFGRYIGKQFDRVEIEILLYIIQWCIEKCWKILNQHIPSSYHVLLIKSEVNIRLVLLSSFMKLYSNIYYWEYSIYT